MRTCREAPALIRVLQKAYAGDIPTATHETEMIRTPGTGDYVCMLLIGLAWAVVPLATLTNFRGYRERLLRRALRDQERLRRLPPYRWRRSDPESDRRFATAMQLLVATVFILAAVALVVFAVIGLARQPTGG